MSSVCFSKDGPFMASFSCFCHFLFKNTMGFADVRIWTADIWCRKQQLYQLSHNHCLKACHLYETRSWKFKIDELAFGCNAARAAFTRIKSDGGRPKLTLAVPIRQTWSKGGSINNCSDQTIRNFITELKKILDLFWSNWLEFSVG